MTKTHMISETHTKYKHALIYEYNVHTYFGEYQAYCHQRLTFCKREELKGRKYVLNWILI